MGENVQEAMKFEVEENGRKTRVLMDLWGW